MSEHESQATAPAHVYPASAANPTVQKALAFNHLAAVPSTWAIDGSGQLRIRDAEGSLGPLVPVDEPTKSSFLNELMHALPYIGAAELMGMAGAFIGGGSALPAGVVQQGGLLASNAAAGTGAAVDVAAGAVAPALTAGTVAEAAAAAGVPALEGGAYGLSSAAAAGLGASSAVPAAAVGGGAAAFAPATAANMAATSSIASGGAVPASLAAPAYVPPVTGGSMVPWRDIYSVGSNLFGNLFGAYKQGEAADKSAAIMAASAKYSADLQAKAAADSLAFQYGTAENAYQNNEVSRRGNYDMWRARERRLGTIGEEVGLGPREIPEYVGGVDPHYGTVGGAAAGVPAPGQTGGVYDAIRAYQQDPANKAGAGIGAMQAALAAKGYKLDRFMYGNTPSNNEFVVNGEKFKVIGGEDSPASAYFYTPGTNDSAGASRPMAGAPVARTLAAPTPFMNAVPQNLSFYA